MEAVSGECYEYVSVARKKLSSQLPVQVSAEQKWKSACLFVVDFPCTSKQRLHRTLWRLCSHFCLSFLAGSASNIIKCVLVMLNDVPLCSHKSGFSLQWKLSLFKSMVSLNRLFYTFGNIVLPVWMCWNDISIKKNVITFYIFSRNYVILQQFHQFCVFLPRFKYNYLQRETEN